MTLVYTHTATSADFNSQPGTPKAGRAIYCKRCSTVVTTTRFLVSRAYRGFRGKAALYSHVDSEATSLGPTSVQLMQTGAYTVRALTCGTCHAYLGFTFVRAHEKTEEWKANHSVLEAASVREDADPLSASVHSPLPPLEPVRPSTPASAETDMSDLPEEMAAPQARPRRPLPSPHANSVWRKTVVKLSSAGRLAGSRHSRSISSSTDGSHHHAPWVIE